MRMLHKTPATVILKLVLTGYFHHCGRPYPDYGNNYKKKKNISFEKLN